MKTGVTDKDGNNYPTWVGVTRPQFHATVTAERYDGPLRSNGCRDIRVNLHWTAEADTDIEAPHWTDDGAVSAQCRERAKQFTARIQEHEAVHARHARDVAARANRDPLFNTMKYESCHLAKQEAELRERKKEQDAAIAKLIGQAPPQGQETACGKATGLMKRYCELGVVFDKNDGEADLDGLCAACCRMDE